MDDYLKYRDKSRDRGERDRDREETGRSVTSLIENFEKEERIRSASRERKYDRDVGMRENGYNGSSPYSYLKDGGGGRNRDGLRDRDFVIRDGRRSVSPYQDFYEKKDTRRGVSCDRNRESYRDEERFRDKDSLGIMEREGRRSVSPYQDFSEKRDILLH